MDGDKIYKIKYTDAYYIDSSYGRTKKLRGTKLPINEAYGYLKKEKDILIITFLREKGAIKINKSKDLIQALILPETALVSVTKKFKTKKLKKIKIGDTVMVTWWDVVYVQNMAVYEPSIMYTEASLIGIKRDHIVLKDPETIRIHPLPIHNHPKEKPLFFIIPISFIKNISVVKKSV